MEIFIIDVPLQDKIGKTELPPKEFWLNGLNLAIGNPLKAFCRTVGLKTLYQLPKNFEKSNKPFLDIAEACKLEKPGEAYALLILDAYRQGFQTALTRISNEPLDRSRLNKCNWKKFEKELQKLSVAAETFPLSDVIDSNPRTYPPIPELCKLLATQMEEFGLDKSKTKVFIFACENLFLANLFDIASKKSHRYRPFLGFCRPDINSIREVEKDFSFYLKSVVSYKIPLTNLTSEVYIPPQAEYWPNPGKGMTKETWLEPCFIEDAQNCLNEWLHNEDSPPFFLVAGDPGSGKSVMFKKWAATLASPNNPFASHLPIIVPASKILSTSNPVSGILESLQSQGFFETEHPQLFPPDRKTVLILEFLDDLWLNSESVAAFDSFIKRTNQLIEEDKNGNLKIAISSHNIPAQSVAEALGNKVLCLSLLPLKFEIHKTRANSTKFLAFDNRIKWQNALKKQIKIGSDEIFSKLNSDWFENISGNPWINQTLTDIALNENLHGKAPNDIYEIVVLHSFNLMKKLAKQPWPILEKDYFRLLEEIAVACVNHGGAATLDQIRNRIHDAGRKDSLDSLKNFFSSPDPLLGLMTTSFMDAKWTPKNERVFYFSFSSLQNYLMARCLSDTAWQMRNQRAIHKESKGDEGWKLNQALVKWIKLTGPIILDNQILKLLRGEEKRFFHDLEGIKKLQIQFGLFLSEAVKNNLPIQEALIEMGLETDQKNLNRFFSNSTTALLAFCAYCGKTSNRPTEVDWGDSQGFISLIKRITLYKKLPKKIVFQFFHDLNFDRQNFTEDDKENKEENEKEKLDFSEANFSRSSFKYANLAESKFEKADFSDANFSMANLQAGNYMGANLQGADFGTTKLHLANFYKAVIDKKNYEVAQKKGALVRGAFAVRLGSKHQNSHQTPVRLEDRKNRSNYYNAQETFYD